MSIPTNIAEGNSKESDLDNRRFIQVALGFANELETLLIVTGTLGFADQKELMRILEMVRKEQCLLFNFINKLKPAANSQ